MKTKAEKAPDWATVSSSDQASMDRIAKAAAVLEKRARAAAKAKDLGTYEPAEKAALRAFFEVNVVGAEFLERWLGDDD